MRGTQRIGSVKYLFGRPLIPSDFLEENCHLELSWYAEKFNVCCFRIVKNVVLATEKQGQLSL